MSSSLEEDLSGKAGRYEVLSHSEAETAAAGRALSSRLAPGALVLLMGGLGAGKTCFVRGLAEGLGADPLEVASPTFALVHEYGPDPGRPVLAHADFYRLGEEESRKTLPELGLEDLIAGGAVVAIEWPSGPFVSWPGWKVAITVVDENTRAIRISPPDAEGARAPV
ncbi:MAG: tRNA (adenosine(37)-N6)-threonylcarbamoyltransferase complex ATPase subunit type 1 TsaE [Thermoanaerobaculia bacterium]|nr:tRNA (adenosine(37)-N6)-threonylcarbamoyltransferase complex ATPase subunit type 1 TsaE [Thermoanaerobaculia bacterium]